MRLRRWEAVSVRVRLCKCWVYGILLLALIGNGEGLPITQRIKSGVEIVDLILQGVDMIAHCAKFPILQSAWA